MHSYRFFLHMGLGAVKILSLWQKFHFCILDTFSWKNTRENHDESTSTEPRELRVCKVTSSVLALRESFGPFLPVVRTLPRFLNHQKRHGRSCGHDCACLATSIQSLDLRACEVISSVLVLGEFEALLPVVRNSPSILDHQRMHRRSCGSDWAIPNDPYSVLGAEGTRDFQTPRRSFGKSLKTWKNRKMTK